MFLQRKTYPVLFLLFVICYFPLISCEKSDDRLRRELRSKAARKVNDRKSKLRPTLDSLCALNHDADLRFLVDSIYKIRKAEMDKIADF